MNIKKILYESFFSWMHIEKRGKDETTGSVNWISVRLIETLMKMCIFICDEFNDFLFMAGIFSCRIWLNANL